jgi:hypothetical protein
VKYKLVTCLGPGGWDLYGRRFADSIQKHWPNAALEIWCHDIDVLPSHPAATFRSLNETGSFLKLKEILKGNNGPTLQYCFKAIALAGAVEQDLEWIGFIDADTEFFYDVDDNLLSELFDPQYHLTYLRRGFGESEGSWFAFNVATPNGSSMLADFWGVYDSLEFLHYKKQHDNAMLDRLVAIHSAHGLKVKNLAPGALGLDTFHQSPLAAYACHYKGPNKDSVADPSLGSPARYDLLCQVVQHAVKSVVQEDYFMLTEVGTWNGSRAVHMTNAAIAAGANRIHYTGYDTFEGGNDRQHEGHSKPHASYDRVSRRLYIFSSVLARQGIDFTYELVKGNTNDTLKRKQYADLVYIDGGHSIDTTRNDYNAFKDCPFVVFDDIIKEPEEGAPDGPRVIFNEIPQTVKKQLLRTGDPYAGLSQTISLGVVVQPKYELPRINAPLQVQPVDSVDRSEQLNFIRSNTTAIDKWFPIIQAHEQKALLVSAGPTLSEFLPEIYKEHKAGAKVFAVKHAVPMLLEAGIIPDFVVVLDARSPDEPSTHGIIRKDLFNGLPTSVPILFATMTNPAVREMFERRGQELWGWHAHTSAVMEAKLPELQTGLVINGGTCAATRLPMLAYTMGFRRMTFYGFDFFYPAGTDGSKLSQALLNVVVGEGGREILTTGELVAAIQDLGMWIPWLIQNKLSVDFRGDGVGADMWKQMSTNYKRPTEWGAWVTS